MRGWGGERRGSQLTRDQFAHPETTGARPDTLNTQSIAVNPGVNRCQPPVTRLSTQLTDDQTRPYLDRHATPTPKPTLLQDEPEKKNLILLPPAPKLTHCLF